MVPGFCDWQSPYVNLLANLTEQDKFADGQGLAKRSYTGSNKTPTLSKVLIPPKAPILPLIIFPIKDLFMKFMKAFMELMQVLI